MAGRLLWFRVKVQGMSSKDAWDEVFPGGNASDRSKQKMASRFLKWYGATYPATFNEVAAEFDLTPERVGVKLMEKDAKWRRQFVEQEENKRAQLNTPPEQATVEQWEAWAQNQDLLGDIERARKEATKARDARLAAEGRTPPTTPPFNHN